MKVRRVTKRMLENLAKGLADKGLRHDQALPRVGNTPASRLAWLLSFCQGEPSTLPAIAFQELVDEIRVFSTNAGYRSPADEPWTPSREDVEDLARRIRAGAEGLFTGRGPSITDEDVGRFVESLTGRPGQTRLVATYSGAPRGAFLRAAFDLLKLHGHRVKKCRYRECGRLFSAAKGQAYHAPLCSQRERTARWASKKSPEQLYQARHERYEQNVRKEKGTATASKVRRLGPRKKVGK